MASIEPDSRIQIIFFQDGATITDSGDGETMDATELKNVLDLQEKYKKQWRYKEYHYWLMRLMQETGELASVLANDHDHTQEHELRQIASIALNWLDMIVNDKKNDENDKRQNKGS